MARRPAPVTKARRGSSRTPTVAAVITVIILAVVVLGGVFLFRDGTTPAGPIPALRVDATYETAVQDGVILAGSATAPRTLDVYEDALCPACRQFAQGSGEAITRALEAGRLQVRYHLVNLLDERSRPAGYSTAAGNAMICAAESGAFPSVHASLYAAQPQESGGGYTTDQLVGLGAELGAAPGYARCVQDGTHTSAIARNFAQASTDPALQRTASSGSRTFGTPTVVLDGQVLEPGARALDDAVSG